MQICAHNEKVKDDLSRLGTVKPTNLSNAQINEKSVISATNID